MRKSKSLDAVGGEMCVCYGHPCLRLLKKVRLAGSGENFRIEIPSVCLCLPACLLVCSLIALSIML